MRKELTGVFLIRGTILVIIKINYLDPSIVTLESFKTSESSLYVITKMETSTLVVGTVRQGGS